MCWSGYFGIQKRLFLPPQKPNGLRLITLMAMASKMRSFYCVLLCSLKWLCVRFVLIQNAPQIIDCFIWRGLKLKMHMLTFVCYIYDIIKDNFCTPNWANLLLSFFYHHYPTTHTTFSIQFRTVCSAYILYS